MQSFGYELLYILPGTASHDELARAIVIVGEILKKEDANVLYHEFWSERRLAYRIKQSDTGKYILCYFKVSADATLRIAQALRLLTVLTRHRIIKHENIEAAMNAFFSYEEALREKRRAAIARPKERRFEQARLYEPIEKQAEPETTMEQKPEEKHEPEQVKEEHKREEMSQGALPAIVPLKKKPSLAELDQKLDKLLGEDIEL